MIEKWSSGIDRMTHLESWKFPQRIDRPVKFKVASLTMIVDMKQKEMLCDGFLSNCCGHPSLPSLKLILVLAIPITINLVRART